MCSVWWIITPKLVCVGSEVVLSPILSVMRSTRRRALHPGAFFRPRRAAATEPWRLEQARHATMLCVLCGGILGQWSRLLSCINDAHKRALAWNNALFDYGPIMCSWAVSRALSPPPPPPASLCTGLSFPVLCSSRSRTSIIGLQCRPACLYIYTDRYVSVCILSCLSIPLILRLPYRRVLKLCEPLREMRRPHFPNQVGQDAAWRTGSC